MSSHVARAQVLMQTGRPELAEQELRRALADDPHDPHLHALLSLCLAQAERHAEALDEARHATGLDPDDPFPRYAEARALLALERRDEAERAIREAVALAPGDPEFHAVLAAILLDRRRWSEALAEAETALEADPEHVLATNLRAQALVFLDRRDEAGATLRAALARDPENAYTHASQGWALLHAGQQAAALEHFRESLRLDPRDAWAKAGLVEALKARNPVYAGMLRYFLWMSRLEPRTQWIVVIGGLLGYRVLARVAADVPALNPLVVPLMVAYLGFVLMSWTADQLFNLVLFTSPVGRHALTEEQKTGAILLGGVVALALGALAIWAVGGSGVALLAAGLSAGLMIPLSATLRGRGRGRMVMGAATAAIALAAVGTVAFEATGDAERAATLFPVALLGIVASSWIGNVVAQRA